MAFIRAISIYDNSGKRVMTAQTGDLSTENAGDVEIGDGGEVIGFTSGAITNSFTCDTVFTVEGNVSTQQWADALELGAVQKVQFATVDGKVEQGNYYVKSRKVSWDHKAGTCKGSFSFTGGANSRI